ncbi:flavin-containing monooxygenase [Nocardia nova]|uniref:flavin-containing monooxygenase n=1 Tax=Nocardia nova TaxID=37330 RepID=UPI0018932D25|nr:NAD(P)/FAD-dependent oxidoreductase [Nocardia nova]MBF6149115.1 NAD(P)/FAD-dependent oxidoreductase [Nocardia nova]
MTVDPIATQHRDKRTPPDRHIVIVGAGIAGIGMAITLRRNGIDNFTVLERAGDIGGVWRDNVYPGVGADVPSFSYQFSFEKNPGWSRLFPKGEEIKRYLDRCVEKYDIARHIELGTEVLERRWSEGERVWYVHTNHGEFTSRYVISALGPFVNPRTPSIPGLEDFTGIVMRSQQWDHRQDLTARRVAVIGTGASAVQLVPKVAETAAHLTVFQRRPIHVLPKLDIPVPGPLQRVIAAVPGSQDVLRLAFTAQVEVLLVAVAAYGKSVAPLARGLSAASRALLFAQVRDPGLREKLTPDYDFGCKRPSVSNAWYRTFTRDNVSLVTEPIDHVTSTGVRTVDGAEHPVDVLVLATGFHFAHEPINYRISPVQTSDGFDLAEFFETEALQSYEGVSLPQLPNAFSLFGPYSWSGGSYHVMVETQANHIIRVLREAERRGADRVAVRPEANARFLEFVRARADNSLLAISNCASANSYYFDHHGDFSSLRPTSGLQAWWTSRTFPLDDYAYN